MAQIGDTGFEVSSELNPARTKVELLKAIYIVREPEYIFKALTEEEGFEPLPFFTKPNPPQDDQTSEISFLLMLNCYRGTVLKLIWPQVLFSLFLNLLASLYCTLRDQQELDLPIDIVDMHKLTGSIVGFLLVFRTNLAYDRYYEGRKLSGQILNATREMTSQAYVFLPKSESSEFRCMQEEMRRLSLLLWCTMRQSLRESYLGFHPLTSGPPSVYNRVLGTHHCRNTHPFKKYWAHDSCRPLISSVMSKAEKEVRGRTEGQSGVEESQQRLRSVQHDHLSPRVRPLTLTTCTARKQALDLLPNPKTRPAAVMTKMRVLSQRMSPLIAEKVSFSLNFMESSKAVVDLLKFADRIGK